MRRTEIRPSGRRERSCAEHRSGGAGDSAQLRQHCPDLRRHRQVEPRGFDVSDRAVKRAGLDYWHLVEVEVHPSLAELFVSHPEAERDLWLATTKAPRDYSQARFSPDCWLFFGKETAGLPLEFRERHQDRCIRIPMVDEARSLNLANSAAILIYEALRQNRFPGLLGVGEMGSPHA